MSTGNKYSLTPSLSLLCQKGGGATVAGISVGELKCALMDGFQVMPLHLCRGCLSREALKSVEAFLCGPSCAQGRGERWFVCKEVGS